MISKLGSRSFILIAIAIFTSCTERTAMPVQNSTEIKIASNAIDINTASADELERIPHIGPQLASEIVKFRERHGRFRRPENLMLIRGFSDGRYRAIKDLIKAE